MNEINAGLELYRAAFAFALQLGARIGADPLNAPNVKDLIAQYRVEWAASAA